MFLFQQSWQATPSFSPQKKFNFDEEEKKRLLSLADKIINDITCSSQLKEILGQMKNGEQFWKEVQKSGSFSFELNVFGYLGELNRKFIEQLSKSVNGLAISSNLFNNTLTIDFNFSQRAKEKLKASLKEGKSPLTGEKLQGQTPNFLSSIIPEKGKSDFSQDVLSNKNRLYFDESGKIITPTPKNEFSLKDLSKFVPKKEKPEPIYNAQITHGTKPGQKDIFGNEISTPADANAWKENISVLKSKEGDYFVVRLPNSYAQGVSGSDAEAFIDYVDVVLPMRSFQNLALSLLDEKNNLSIKNVDFERDVLPLLVDVGTDVVLIFATAGVAKVAKGAFKIGKVAARNLPQFLSNPEFRKVALGTFKKFDNISAEEASNLARQISSGERTSIKATTKEIDHVGNQIKTTITAKPSKKFKIKTEIKTPSNEKFNQVKKFAKDGSTKSIRGDDIANIPKGEILSSSTTIRPTAKAMAGKSIHAILYTAAGAYSIDNVSKAIEISPLFADKNAPLPSWANEFAKEHNLQTQNAPELRQMIFDYLKQDLAVFWAIWLSVPAAGLIAKETVPKVYNFLNKAFSIAKNNGKTALIKYINENAPQIAKMAHSNKEASQLQSELVDLIWPASQKLGAGVNSAQYGQMTQQFLATSVRAAVTAEMFSEDAANALGLLPVFTGKYVDLPFGDLSQKLDNIPSSDIAQKDLYASNKEQYAGFVNSISSDFADSIKTVYSSSGTVVTDKKEKEKILSERLESVHEHTINGSAFASSFVLNVMYVDTQQLVSKHNFSTKDANNVADTFAYFVPSNDFELKNLDKIVIQTEYQKQNLDAIYNQFEGKGEQFWAMITNFAKAFSHSNGRQYAKANLQSFCPDLPSFLQVSEEFGDKFFSMPEDERQAEAMKIIFKHILQGNIDFKKTERFILMPKTTSANIDHAQILGQRERAVDLHLQNSQRQNKEDQFFEELRTKKRMDEYFSDDFA